MESCIYTGKIVIVPGSMEREHLMLLVKLARVNSQRVILALEAHLVDGFSRKDACEENDLSQGYFSLVLRKVFDTH
ncbi:PbsX family transcriptional regulator, partial [Escherichia coli]|nr:PbsX family transcriptional regulator [Escherichia coli]